MNGQYSIPITTATTINIQIKYKTNIDHIIFPEKKNKKKTKTNLESSMIILSHV